ncbi:hypothetical protein CFP71_01340 [Amycolatopsis thailandensis]|uniref:Uncharacterized protein n=1 Tax=Amycolatopsis thailandensis TaxID=589330 RepID=A0A229SIK5_9PSEU|nr:hypothetical protein [Amycolatopsis thailandensis]OXM58686.1 hypothetical protein CFP71_01340 [Amycolatopsis thailandensis]
MSAPAKSRQQDPKWVLDKLVTFLIVEYQKAVTEYAAGNRMLSDRDRMTGYSATLAFLDGLTDGQMGLSTDQLQAVRDMAEEAVSR